jgi:hypothetical protein
MLVLPLVLLGTLVGSLQAEGCTQHGTLLKDSGAPSTPVSVRTAPKAHILIIAGLGGEPQYEQAFYELGSRMAEAMRTKYGVPDSSVMFLAEHPARDSQHIRGPSTRVEIERAFARIATVADTGDLVFVLLIGHGTAEGDKSRFNLPGPDMTAADFAALLTPLAAQRVAFVNAASAGGDFIAALSGKDRAIVTATSSVAQSNVTKFARHFVDAYAADSTDADSDKDGRISLLEAFVYARREVAREYEASKLLQPEHARLDDDGDGEGSDAPGPDAADGRLAARLSLVRRTACP